MTRDERRDKAGWRSWPAPPQRDRGDRWALTLPAHDLLKAPETGTVMVEGRAGGAGRRFNLGEATVTRCVVRLADGAMGFSYALGRDGRKARLAAILDAQLQREAPGGAAAAGRRRSRGAARPRRANSPRARPPRPRSISSLWSGARDARPTRMIAAGLRRSRSSSRRPPSAPCSRPCRSPARSRPYQRAIEPPDGLDRATATALLTLADYETPIWLPRALARRRGRRLAALPLRRGAGRRARRRRLRRPRRRARTPRSSPLSMSAHDQFPDRSTTVLVQCAALEGGAPVTLTGPGIAGTQDDRAAGLRPASGHEIAPTMPRSIRSASISS